MPSKYDDLIEKHFRRVGLDPELGRKVMRIESGGDTYNVTGSYRGLFQLSHSEFKKHGGSGSIHSPEQNTMAAANKLAQEARDFKDKYGRDPKPIDIYMIHQQGAGGYAAHIANPDQPAWKSMASTGEGKAKGEAWAKRAIWGNIPDKDKARYGSVENVTSKQFVNDVWGKRVEGGEAEFGTRPGGGGGVTDEAKVGKPKDLLAEKGKRKPSILGFDPAFEQEQISVDIPNLHPRFSIG